MKLGMQISIQGGLDKVIDRALELGCNCIQFFSRNPREWKRKKLNKKEVELFKKKLKDTNISPVVIHAPYTCNLASPKKKLYRDSVKAFIRDVQDADVLGADFFVFHMGSHTKSSEKEGLDRVTEALKTVFEKLKPRCTILLENTSGSGSWLGYTFWHHNYILKKLKWNKKIGVCLDTCHSFCAGYDISTEEGLENLLEEIDKAVGLERLKLIHLNDSKDKLGSRKDRHFHIGEGFIGLEAFKRIVNHPKLRDLPFILETPNKNPSDDPKNLMIVKSIRIEN